MKKLLTALLLLSASHAFADTPIADWNPPSNGATIDEKRRDLDLELDNINAVKQPIDADLTCYAALTPTADTIAYFTGPGTCATTSLSAFVRGLIDETTGPAFWAAFAGDELAQDAIGLAITDSSIIDFTYNDGANTLTGTVIANSIGDSQLRQGAAVSVIGRSAGTVGNVADIVAGADNHVLRRVSGVLGFGTLDGASIASGTVPDAQINGANESDEVTMGGDLSGAANNAQYNANSVANGDIRQSAALSVIGRSANSLGNVADIAAVAASDGVMRESGSAIGFGQVATGGIADDAVTNAKIRNSAAVSVIGRSAGTGGDPADIAAGADNDVLRRAGGALGFGTLDAASIGSGTLADARVDGSLEADELVLSGDVDGTANNNDIDEAAVETELESVMDLPDLQGVLTAAKGGTGDNTGATTGVPRINGGDWLYDAGISHLQASTSADLAGVLSDEQGSAGGFMRGTGSTATTLTLDGVTTLGNGAGNDNLTVVAEATNPACSSGQYKIWANSADLKLKKCQDGTISDLAGAGGGGGLTDAYDKISDGSTTASASTNDTIKFRVNKGLSAVVGSNDVTHGDNVLFDLNGMRRSTKTGNYTLVAADYGTTVELGTNAATFSLTAAATLGNGWWAIVRNANSITAANELTIDPNSTETIDALTTSIDLPGASRLIYTDGSNWFSHLLTGGAARYTSNATFTMPPGTTSIQVVLYGGGGAGGGGHGAAAATIRGGASGGGGGARSERMFNATDVAAPGATVSVTVGAGATGAAAAADGTAGAATTFGSLLSAGGGGGGDEGDAGASSSGGGGGGVGGAGANGGTAATSGGAPGTTAAGMGGGGGGGGTNAIGGAAEYGGGAGGGSLANSACNAGATKAGGASLYGATGGGAGGCISSANVVQTPGSGGARQAYSGTGVSGGTSGATCTDGVQGNAGNSIAGAGGGGGGGSDTNSAGCVGGAGGVPGGGGGGGGGGTTTGGAGGSGGNGAAYVWYR